MENNFQFESQEFGDVQFTVFEPSDTSGFATISNQDSGEIMLSQKLRDVLRIAIIGSLVFVICQSAFAQDQSQPAGNPPARKSKASADSCDGALDIVPTKSMTFTRKRRPAKAEQPNPVDAKDVKESKDSKDVKPEKRRESGGGNGD